MIIAIGDIHGDFKTMYDKIKQIGSIDSDERISFIQIGDFGVGFDDDVKIYSILKRINEVLVEYDNILYVIRGNHDDPSYWSDWLKTFKFSNIVFVPDDTILTLDNKVCYFAGGAISIDRRGRTIDKSYWIDEGYKYKDVLSILPRHIDILFTHDVCHDVSRYDLLSGVVKAYRRYDGTLMDDLIANQIELQKLFRNIVETNSIYSDQPLKIIHGHYHKSHTDVYPTAITKCLAIMEFFEVT